ncbi:MAG TPA: class I SAM-dependent methyltransferase [Gammaproteobacteria bacterium]|nr:class I SAM-dependent methyltransferase [Gammaproteobacteria bacterium]
MENQVRHNYEYDVDLDGETAPARVVRMVGQNKRVLEIGAGPGSITRHLQGHGGCAVTALELDSEAIKLLSPFCEKVYQANLNDPDWPQMLSAEDRFDVVVAADVLEHLYDPWTTLGLMKRFLNENGCLVISLPHVGHSSIAACLLQEDFNYRDWGLLDRTNIRFFGIRNIQALFENAGLKIIHAEFVVVPPEETEFSGTWSELPAEVQLALASNRFGCVYQVVIKAVPENASGSGLQLVSMPVETRLIKASDKLKSMARSRLSPATRQKIRALISGIRSKLST